MTRIEKIISPTCTYIVSAHPFSEGESYMTFDLEFKGHNKILRKPTFNKNCSLNVIVCILIE